MSDAMYQNVYQILDRLQIQYPPLGFSIPDAWIPPVTKALEEMISLGWNRDLQQVKVKFGGLRLYIGSGAPEAVNAVVARIEAELQS